MIQYSSGNKRVAKNTLFMYVRLFVTMLIGLYTSRVVLLTLGISDYGLYGVVGGLMAMFTFISGSLMGATTRFLNVEMGKPNGNLNKCFNINLLLHTSLAIIVLILSEGIGVWYIKTKLVVEPGKLGDAMAIFQISIITACLGIVNEPYASLFNAHERFGLLAVLDIINVFIRLCFVLLLRFTGDFALICYSIIMSLTTVNSFVVYHWIAARDWPDIIKIHIIKGWENYKNVLVFSGWNLLATLFLMLRSTGSDLIINRLFGTAMNGAFSISKTVNNYITSFSVNFDSASGPQIIQSYSAGNISRCVYLVNKMGRFTLLLFLLVFFPLSIELDFILHLWLKEVPDGVLVFCQMNLLLAAVSLTCGGLIQVINASGKIKWFKIEGSILSVLFTILGFILCKNGAPAYTMIIVFIIADVINRIIQLILLKTIIGFNSLLYVKEAYARPALIATIMSVGIIFYSRFGVESSILKFFAIIICSLTTAALVFAIGLTKEEKRRVLSYVKKVLLPVKKNK